MKSALCFTLLILALGGCYRNNEMQLGDSANPFTLLSEYHFFTGTPGDLKPNKSVIEYSLINTMFADYAHKKSFVCLPGGKQLQADSAGNLAFPDSSCLINCVYYLNDERDETKGKTLVETQLLILTHGEWKAQNYIWNEQQTDAELSLVGDIKKEAWFDKNAGKHETDFVIAGKNQCKSCHNSNGKLVPIGFTTAELNHENQLQQWNETGLLRTVSTTENPARHVFWKDTSAQVEMRVRAYLNINCAHCHNEKGPAKISGLFLTYENRNMETYGVCKSPPSAGKGSCNLKCDIVPGKPGESIIVCRMASTDLEVKMPELGRTQIDNEGVSLIIQWISEMPASTCSANE